MTEQEAREFAARLTRIWVPKGLETEPACRLEHRWKERARKKGKNEEQGWMHFTFNIGNVIFEMNQIPEGGFSLKRQDGATVTGELYCSQGSAIILSDVLARPEQKRSYAQFTEEWLPFFRRGCWLSGCDIEASDHEKAEWIQGFTKEEIEAWKLKM